ncbi:MAG: CapA family protein [Deltaproteobacteria bacterium]|nr:CapA family protein [Deltaproteobacteria bacterium]
MKLSIHFFHSRRPFFFAFLLFVLLSNPVYSNQTAVSSHIRAEAHFQKGIQFLLKGQLIAAEKEMNQSLKFDWYNGKIHWETGWVYWQKKEWQKVIYHWEFTEKFTPDQKDLNKFLYLSKQYLKLEGKLEQTPIIKAKNSFKENLNPEDIVITAVGDIMLGSNYISEKKLPPDDGIHLFANVVQYLKGNIVFGNLEAPLTKQVESQKCKKGGNCYVFRTPPSYSRLLKKAGFNVLNIANNHIVDFGIPGVEETIEVLTRQDLNSFGYISTPSLIVDSNGVKIAFLGVSTTYCCIHINEMSKSEKIVKMLKQQADIVIVSFHAGAEGLGAARTPIGKEYFFGEFRGNVRLFSHRMIEAGADLILGHGPHTIRGMEYYKDKLIAYSLGNFMGYLGFNTSGHLKYSLILQITMSTTGQLKRARIIPIQLSPRVIPEFDPQGNSLVLINDLSLSDFGDSAFLFDIEGYWQQ